MSIYIISEPESRKTFSADWYQEPETPEHIRARFGCRLCYRDMPPAGKLPTSAILLQEGWMHVSQLYRAENLLRTNTVWGEWTCPPCVKKIKRQRARTRSYIAQCMLVYRPGGVCAVTARYHRSAEIEHDGWLRARNIVRGSAHCTYYFDACCRHGMCRTHAWASPLKKLDKTMTWTYRNKQLLSAQWLCPEHAIYIQNWYASYSFEHRLQVEVNTWS